MADPKDIEKTLEASDEDVLSLKKQGVESTGGNTRMKAPVDDIQRGLNQELVNMLTLGKKSYQFQGIDRCIRILEKGTPNQRHCLAMMLNNLSTNTRVCSSCDRIRDPNANPKVINSSMIRLSQKQLEECGLEADPLLNKKAEPIKPAKRLKEVKETQPVQRRPKVAVPSTVKIEITMKELEENPNIVDVLLQKALESIYDLPITKYSEAEAIRGTSERIKKLLAHDELQGD